MGGKAVGFSITAPDKLEGYPQRTIQTMSGTMIQVIYENDCNTVFVRKQAGDGDISGDYTEYPQTKVEKMGDVSVTMKGENGLFMVAIWNDGGHYTYAITSHIGMSATDVATLVQSVG